MKWSEYKLAKLIYSEYLKGKHTFTRKSLFLFPFLISLMAVCLMGGQLTQIGAYNWWYMLLLPAIVALICTQLIDSDKKINYFNLAILPYYKTTIWHSKIYIGCLYVFVSNFVVFGFTTFSGLFFGSQYPIQQGLLAGIVLTITWIWQIPLGLFLALKCNSTVTFVSIIGLNMLFSIQDFSAGFFWFIPFSIAPRLMATIIAVNPNGVPLQPNSPLYNTNVIFPGLLITILLFLFIAWFTTKKVEKRQN